MPATYTKVILYTDPADGRSKFREEQIPLDPAGAIGYLTDIRSATGYQLRHSPVAYANTFHNTQSPQWVFILQGTMRIGLRDGTHRDFTPGQSFFSADFPPQNNFPEDITGHSSAQVGDEPLVTLFLKAEN